MLVLEHPTVNYISLNAELVTQGVTCFSYQSDASVIECPLASLRKEEENGVDGVIMLFMYVVEKLLLHDQVDHMPFVSGPTNR